MKERIIYGTGGAILARYVDGVLVEGAGAAPIGVDYQVMPDITPYRSMIDGTLIRSRSQHREHLRMHGCVEVGNDSSLRRTQCPPLQSPPGLKETLARLVYSKLRY